MLELKVDAQQQEIDRLSEVNNTLQRDNNNQLDGNSLRPSRVVTNLVVRDTFRKLLQNRENLKFSF